MDRSLLLGAAVVLLCWRDGRLLATRPRLVLVAVPLVMVAAIACGLLAERLSLDQSNAWLADSRFWLTATFGHGLLAFHASRRSRSGKRADWISVLPTPVWAVSMIGGSRLALAWLDGVTGLTVGLLLGAGYAGAFCAIAFVLRANRDASGALRFASAVQGSAIALFPAAMVLDRPLATQAVDWRASLLVAGLVAALLLASFGLHRRGR